MILNLGQQFKMSYRGNIIKAFVIYDEKNEKTPYLVVDKNNSEVIAHYSDIKNIPTYEPIKVFNKVILGMMEANIPIMLIEEINHLTLRYDAKEESEWAQGASVWREKFKLKEPTEVEKAGLFALCQLYNIKIDKLSFH